MEIIERVLGEWGRPLIILVGAVAIGWLFKKVINRYLQKIVKRTAIKTDDLIYESIESQIIIWIALIAAYYITKTTELLNQYSENIVKVIVFLLIISITFALNKFFIGMIEVWSAKQKRALPSTKIFVNLVRAIIFTIGLLVALDYIGVAITPMLTALGVGGLAISLALKDTLSDVFAGLHILLSKKVVPGDFIELESGQKGDITNITWRNSTIVERTNNVFIVPNSVLSSGIIKNYDSIDRTFTAKMTLGVGYESDLSFVEKVTVEVAKEVVSGIEEHVKDFTPIVRFYEFGDSSINIKVFFKVYRYGDQWAIFHKFIKQLLVRYNKEGINIPFPIRTIYHMNNIEMDEK